MNVLSVFFIISAHVSGEPESEDRHQELGDRLEELGGTKEVIGFCNEEEEKAWLFQPLFEPEHGVIKDILTDYGQKTALFVDGNRASYYVYAEEGRNDEFQGKWVAVDTTLNIKNYTVDPGNGQAYTTVTR